LVLRPAAIGLALTGAMLGAARAELPSGDPSARSRAAALVGLQAAVEGEVADDPRTTATGFEVLVDPRTIATTAGLRQPAGKVMVVVYGSTGEPAAGDQVQVSGRLQWPRDQPDFDRRAYLAQQGAFLEMRSAKLEVVGQVGGPRAVPGRLRALYQQGLSQLVPSPHAEVLVGVLLGVRTGIPSRLQKDLIATGLVHLLVLSGLKVAVFARLVTAALGPLLGRAATLPALALIGLYALAGGATPAAVRAACMGGLTLAAQHLGRPTHIWTSLAATAAAMLGWRPDLVWDVGFQLSFAGTVAIILLTPAIERRLVWMPGWAREPFAVTCAAQVGTLPFMATTFRVISPVAPVANALVLPVLPAMIGAGLLLAPLAAVPVLGRMLALPVTGLVAYLEQAAGLLARVPAAAIPGPAFSPASGVAYYVGLSGAVVAARSDGRTRRVALLVGVLVPILIAGGELVAWTRPASVATVLAVGQGQAVLLSGPGGYVLVDGGPSPSKLRDALGAQLPPWRHGLEGLVITGAGQGHAGGLAGFEMPAQVVVLPNGSQPGTTWRTAALTEKALGARLLQVGAGQRLELAGLRLDILSPEPAQPDPGQVGFRVTGPAGHSFCDVADLAPEEQATVAHRLTGTCDALLVPSAGQTAPAPELLRAARPARLIVSDAGG
ncbi:MAG: ComEC/Rec2 family competence protein, partial [Candidatus Dormibacteraeota bacterium]|nr:ComEC/Rec2 family competence protein [Candidatus Dormibacteraeota bacterium]